MMKYYFSAAVMLVSSLLLSACQLRDSITELQLPEQDPNVIIGQLDNGFKYYIAPNQSPNERVYIRLVVNAGSMNEDDDQRGVAHIVEHMAFNGSANFPGNSVIDALEHAGMKFGVDINAFTDFENTVYTLNLPNNKPETVDLALTVVADWAGRVSMNRGDLDAERGIVLEEWRARLGPMLRLGDKKSAIEMAGSRYILRDPIGDPETIKHVPTARVADFYQRWYRPDNMSVVVAGDIDTTQVMTQLQHKLAFLAKPITPLEKIDYQVPLINHWRVAEVSEVGMDTPSLELSFFTPMLTEVSLASYRQDLARQIAIRLLNVRLQEWEKQHPAGIESANFFSSAVGRDVRQNVFTLQLHDQDYKAAAIVLFNQLAQINQQGFSQAEIDHELERLLKLNQHNQDVLTYSIDLAGDLMVTAATNGRWLGDAAQKQLSKQLLTQLHGAEINQAFKQLIAPPARLALMTSVAGFTSKPQLLTQTDIAQAWQQSMTTIQPAYKVRKVDAQLPTLTTVAGSSQFVRDWQQGKVKEYRLSNGSRLFYSFNDASPGEVHFKALTQGGLNSIVQQDYHGLRIAANLADDTGVGLIPEQTLIDATGVYPIVLSTILDNKQQGFSGWSTPDDFATLLQLFRFKLQDVVIDDKLFAQYKHDTLNRLAVVATDPEEIFVREVERQRFGDMPTVYSVTATEMEALSASQLAALYKQYILAKTDFTYFIVGDLPEPQLLRLMDQYLASTPVKHRASTSWRLYPHTPSERLTMSISREPRAEVEIYYTAPKLTGKYAEFDLEIVSAALQEQLRLALREEASGVYGVTSWLWQRNDEAIANGLVRFACDPARAESLIALTKQVMLTLESQGFPQTSVANKQQQMKDELMRYSRGNLGWLEQMTTWYMRDGDLSQLSLATEANNSVNQQRVNQTYNEFIQSALTFETLLLPQK